MKIRQLSVLQKAKPDKMLLDIHLAELREYMDKTQQDIAHLLGIKQPTVASMEKPGRDIKLSSIKRYVEAVGGGIETRY